MKRGQLSLIKKPKSCYGGDLMKKRKGRVGCRPLATRHTMHLVLRSPRARGAWSFRLSKNAREIDRIVGKFSTKYGVRILRFANVGNHLHFWMKLSHRHTYKPFIRAVTSAIAMKVTGYSRWNKGDGQKFWQYRPWTRIIDGGYRAIRLISDYLSINQLEGSGFKRDVAEIVVRENRGTG